MCLLQKEWSRGKKQRPKALWLQVSGLSGIKFMTIDRSSECVCVFGLGWNPAGLRSHHIKPIMDKQPSKTNESREEPETLPLEYLPSRPLLRHRFST